MSNLAGLTLPKGAGPKVDEVAARILLNNGEESLKKMTKWHFANAEKAKNLARRKRR